MAKKKKEQSIWKSCWDEYVIWFCAQWKEAWNILREGIVDFVTIVFQWIYVIFGSIFGGLWKIVLKPCFIYIKDFVLDWIRRL